MIFPIYSLSILGHFLVIVLFNYHKLSNKCTLEYCSFSYVYCNCNCTAYLFLYCKYCLILFVHKKNFHYCSCLYLKRMNEKYHSLLLATAPFFTQTGFYDGTGWDLTVMQFLKNPTLFIRTKSNLTHACCRLYPNCP